jgi:hypothetical protein
MMRSEVVRKGVFPGAVAGVVGSLVFSLAMDRLGSPLSAAWPHFEPTALGFGILLSVAALVGAGFGLFVWHQGSGAGEIFFWGLGYGVFWWFLNESARGRSGLGSWTGYGLSPAGPKGCGQRRLRKQLKITNSADRDGRSIRSSFWAPSRE